MLNRAGNWEPVLGVFASRGNILCENAGIFVDAVTCDGASWNRSMWRSFGIKGKEAVYL